MTGNPTVVWGLSSSIAIYRGVEAIRSLARQGIRVVPMLSAHAEAFIRPLLLETLTGQPVYRSVMELTPDHKILHTQLARTADVLVYAPASANLLAKMAHGVADDLLTTTYLAYHGWTLVAPAMNVHMWRHPATRENVARLQSQGVVFIGPASGPQVDGDVGPGRLEEPERIAATVLHYLEKRHDLQNQTVLVTAGPTREPLDPVRFISNRASGRMGFAMAEAALRRGARVILVSGPTHLIPHPAIHTVFVETTEEMFQAVQSFIDEAQWLIKAAAVADFRPRQAWEKKLKKAEHPKLQIELENTIDILRELAKNKRKEQIFVGFAAETHDFMENAREKLKKKNVDFVVLNRVDLPDRGFAAETNQVVLLARDGQSWESELLPKARLADWIWDHLIAAVRRTSAGAATGNAIENP